MVVVVVGMLRLLGAAREAFPTPLTLFVYMCADNGGERAPVLGLFCFCVVALCLCPSLVSGLVAVSFLVTRELMTHRVARGKPASRCAGVADPCENVVRILSYTYVCVCAVTTTTSVVCFQDTYTCRECIRTVYPI